MTYCLDCYSERMTICTCNHFIDNTDIAQIDSLGPCMYCLKIQDMVSSSGWAQCTATSQNQEASNGSELNPASGNSAIQHFTIQKLAPDDMSDDTKALKRQTIEYFPCEEMPPEEYEDIPMFSTQTKRKRFKQANDSKHRLSSKQSEPVVPRLIPKRNSHLASEILHCSPKDAGHTYSSSDMISF